MSDVEKLLEDEIARWKKDNLPKLVLAKVRTGFLEEVKFAVKEAVESPEFVEVIQAEVKRQLADSLEDIVGAFVKGVKLHHTIHCDRETGYDY